MALLWSGDGPAGISDCRGLDACGSVVNVAFPAVWVRLVVNVAFPAHLLIPPVFVAFRTPCAFRVRAQGSCQHESGPVRSGSGSGGPVRPEKALPA